MHQFRWRKWLRWHVRKISLCRYFRIGEIDRSKINKQVFLSGNLLKITFRNLKFFLSACHIEKHFYCFENSVVIVNFWITCCEKCFINIRYVYRLTIMIWTEQTPFRMISKNLLRVEYYYLRHPLIKKFFFNHYCEI